MTSRTVYSTQTPNKPSLFDVQYLRNHRTLVIGVLGYIGIVWPKEHSPEVRSFPPGTPVYTHTQTLPTCITQGKANLQSEVSKNNCCNFYSPPPHLQIPTTKFMDPSLRTAALQVHSCQQKSIGLKFSKSQTGSDVRYSCHHNSSRFTFPIFAHSCCFCPPFITVNHTAYILTEGDNTFA